MRSHFDLGTSIVPFGSNELYQFSINQIQYVGLFLRKDTIMKVELQNN